ncbi:uroporphyrinogen-III synthase [Furfurilactobacillus siliginis]|uniref:Tetrapyrrole biosynthesis uroporphyrinogen III synthase domain-containing protein n=1 Tax=Furfurilactobacillus siliginis TaxID=348151 RepID=A0A0R2L497_9LACO|nr:uroporphyrinogen-III synthase [Furfurilactobacillus siliginis]KRN96208.1 hypothetical protein IV55_GL001594 [Furfurilactobacillus siliginis]GEK27867.1 hypothetical protein LSI01_01780 [Furfurilactobacillus siliginis]
MARLLLYPQKKVSDALQIQLKDAGPVVYYPLRRLEARNISEEETQRALQAEVVVISSHFALQVFNASLNMFPQVGVACVLSAKMALDVSKQFSGTVVISAQENQSSLRERTLDYSNRKVVWLEGDHFEPSFQKNDQVDVLTVYKNVWLESDTQAAVNVMKNYQFNQILVTSPSAFERLLKIIQLLVNSENWNEASYYTLGERTYTTVQNHFEKVWIPREHHNVLAKAVQQMLGDNQ